MAKTLDLAPLLVVLVSTAWGFFVHANLRWRFGPLEWLVATPAFHHWHHTYEQPHNKNYSSMLPWMDRVFGTYHMPKSLWPGRYGIEEPMESGLAGQLLQPLRSPEGKSS
jgi:sterol desaturase/sphingolipid hydroxylase (fatty acid hydroxylase superfamily)